MVQLIEGDARDYIAGHSGIAFCFLDAEKEIYGDCYELVVPRLVSGGLLVADNAINHREMLQPMLDRAMSDDRVDLVDRANRQRRIGLPEDVISRLSHPGF